MPQETCTILGIGIARAILNIGLIAWLRSDVREHGKQILDVREQMHHLETELRERMAKLGGLLEDLRESISGRPAA